jgi:hypothetical protein
MSVMVDDGQYVEPVLHHSTCCDHLAVLVGEIKGKTNNAVLMRCIMTSEAAPSLYLITLDTDEVYALHCSDPSMFPAIGL